MRYGMSDTEQLRGRLRVRTPHTSQRQTRHDRQEIQTVTITKSRTHEEEERWTGERAIFTTAIGRAVAKRRRSNGSDYKGGAFGWRRWGVGVGGEGGDGGSGCWKRARLARHRPRAEYESRRPWRPSAP